MARRSSRMTPSTQVSAAEKDSDANYLPDAEFEDVEEERKPKKKRVKRSAHPNSKGDQKVQWTRGRRGALQGIAEMPLEILHEIFLHLYPADLLNLSRINKALRRILMTKSVEFIWRQARINLEDLPPRPADLSEFQYARLIFDALCHYCAKADTSSIIWSNRRRCCKKCLRDESVMWTWNGTPVWRYGDFAEILPSIDLRTGQEQLVRLPRKNFFCVRSTAQLLDQYQKLKGDARVEWLREQNEERRQRIVHGRSCEKWIEEQAAKRASDLDAIRTRRYEAIRQKLIELGWEEELQAFGHGLNQLPCVRQAKDLTDRVWNNIKDVIIDALETHKAERLEREHQVAQSRRLAKLAALCESFFYSQEPQNRTLTPFADLVASEPFKTMLKAPASERITFTDALLRESTQTWRRSKESELLNMMVESGLSPDGVDSLSLATTFFKCTKCRNVVGYPEVLMHTCASCRYPSTRPFAHPSESVPWNLDGKCVLFHDRAHHAARTILEASGMDPDTVARKDVQKAGFFIECHECCLDEHSEGRRILMTWLSAVNHAVLHEFFMDNEMRGHQQVQMAIAQLSEDEQKLASTLAIEKLRATHGGLACLRCSSTVPRFTGSWSSLRRHLEFGHISERDPIEPVEFVDYIVEGDISGLPVQPEGVLRLELGNSQKVMELSQSNLRPCR
ncbi:hypothetical protein LshimejAT787_0210250 [Lyophyllum shimeji]|uniref:F-box domain-containing protein n=1 Tax=Lyophyllum shimeji TaxID=47721 RepID=A0A9P3PG74_LYOSH|nr:hypothetical protein LshimejAT787_0210250 [Lyophyllum shimeji]